MNRQQLPLDERLTECADRVEEHLDHWLPAPDTRPKRLHRAMRYAVMGGGKRIRPALIYLAGEALGVPFERLDGPACAAELIHAYSLVHDDLPAMDDDDLRRGRPTCHKAFDEATAILAGDALQVLAFKILASDRSMVPDLANRLQIIRILAEGSGTAGMAGGQAIDLAVQGRSIDIESLERMHRLKTGELIRASLMMAAWSADRPGDAVLESWTSMGEALDWLSRSGTISWTSKVIQAPWAKQRDQTLRGTSLHFQVFWVSRLPRTGRASCARKHTQPLNPWEQSLHLFSSLPITSFCVTTERETRSRSTRLPILDIAGFVPDNP